MVWGHCVEQCAALLRDVFLIVLALLYENLVHFNGAFYFSRLSYFEECLLLKCAEQTWCVLPCQRREGCLTFIPGSLLSALSKVTAALSASQLC